MHAHANGFRHRRTGFGIDALMLAAALSLAAAWAPSTSQGADGVEAQAAKQLEDLVVEQWPSESPPVTSPVSLFVSAALGNDTNAGTSPDAPLATLAAAVVSARRLKPTSILLSGRLQMTESPVTLNSQVEGLTISQWPGKPAAVLSGGIDIPASSWTKTDAASEVWSAPLPAAAAAALSNSSAGAIFVGGVRRNIVRTPTLRWSASVGATGSKRSFIVAKGTLDPKWSLDAASVARWRVAAFHSWTKAYHTVESIDAESGTITFGEEAMFPYGEFVYCSERRFYIEGVPELELSAGSWRMVPGADGDEGASLEYRPAAGERFPPTSTPAVVVPVLPTLLRLYGVRNVTLSGLSFEHTAPGDCRADAHAPACDSDEGAVAHQALVLGGPAEGVTLRSLRFRQVGGFGMYAAGISGLVVERVAAIDCGSGGLFVRSCPGVLINNSIVKGYGARFAAASGVTMTDCVRGTVSHCDVSGGLFSGLAGGGTDDGGAHSVFEFNHVHDIGSEEEHEGLCDFGGYHGSSPGSLLPLFMRSNVFHSITAYANGGSGMYFDVSSTAWQVSRNLVYNVTNAALHWNVNPGVAQKWGRTATPMRFDNNVLIAERDNAFYRENANRSRGGAVGPWGLGNPAITWNGFTPANFTRNVVVVDATDAPSRGAWFEGRPCGADQLPPHPAGIANCSGDLGDSFVLSDLSANLWFNRTHAAAPTPTFPGGCAGVSATKCGPTKGCACRSWAEWRATGQGGGALWQVDPQLGSGPLRLVTAPAALALGIEPLTELARAGADWEADA